jgi:CBS domain-containing protein
VDRKIDYNENIPFFIEPIMSVSPLRLTLKAETASDLMTPNPVSIRDIATVREVVVFLTDRKISAAPVINEAGRPVGVVSEADILKYDREHIEHLAPVPDYYLQGELTLRSGETLSDSFQVETADTDLVRDIMTPIIFAVKPDASAAVVVNELVTRRIHRLFVVDEDGSLVGVVTTLDVLQRLAI